MTLGWADWADPEWPARADAVAQEIARIAIVPAASFPNRIMFSCNLIRSQISGESIGARSQAGA